MRPLAALLAMAATAVGAETLSCDGAGEPFRLELSEGAHCAFAPALMDRTPHCAPDGGWAISDRGSSVTQVTATDPRAVAGRDGGWLFARRSPSILVISAGEGDRPPLALALGEGTFWRLRLDLASGEGVVETAAGLATIRCAP